MFASKQVTARNSIHCADVVANAFHRLFRVKNAYQAKQTNQTNPSYTMREMFTTYHNQCSPPRCSNTLRVSRTFALGSALKACGGVRRQTQWASRVCCDPVPTVGASFLVQMSVCADASVRVLCARIRVVIGLRARAETVARVPVILYHGDKLIGAT